MKSPSVAVLILQQNGEKILDNCLTSLKKSNYPNFKVHVLLYDSKDKSEEVLKKHKINYFKSNKNLGFAGGNNFLINKTKSDYVVFLNNDTEVNRTWLTELISFAEKNKAAACQPKILNLNNKEMFDHAGASGGFIDNYGYPFCRGRIFAEIEKDKGQYNQPKQIFWASGACMLAKRKVLDKLGAFDEDLFLYGEELDLCWRINNSGEKIFAVPDSIIYHLGSYTVKASNMTSLKSFLIQRNTFLALLKNYSSKKLTSVIFQRIFLEFTSAFESFARAKAVAKSLFWLVFHISKVKRMRARAQKTRKVDELSLKNIIYSRSIVFEYYLSGKTKFSQLKNF